MTAGVREGLAVGLLLAAAAAAVIGLSLGTGANPSTRRVVIALDRSGSLGADGCADLERLGRAALSSTVSTELIVLATSPAGIGRLGAVRTTPSGRLLEGRRHDEATRKKLLAPLTDACAALPAAPTSPITELIAVALTYLPARDCPGRGATCQLVVRTDGRESADRQVRRALGGGRGTLEPRFDAGHVAVRFCGLADGRRGRGPSPLHLRRVWRRLFLTPERVRFDAACALFAREVTR